MQLSESASTWQLERSIVTREGAGRRTAAIFRLGGTGWLARLLTRLGDGSVSLWKARPRTGEWDVALIRLVKTVTLGQDANANHYGDVGDGSIHLHDQQSWSVALTTVQLFDPR